MILDLPGDALALHYADTVGECVGFPLPSRMLLLGQVEFFHSASADTPGRRHHSTTFLPRWLKQAVDIGVPSQRRQQQGFVFDLGVLLPTGAVVRRLSDGCGVLLLLHPLLQMCIMHCFRGQVHGGSSGRTLLLRLLLREPNRHS